MSERLTNCPKCHSFNIGTIIVHNPDTQDMNSKATLFCNECKNEFEGLITSKYYENQRKKGYIWI